MATRAKISGDKKRGDAGRTRLEIERYRSRDERNRRRRRASEGGGWSRRVISLLFVFFARRVGERSTIRERRIAIDGT